MNDQQLDLATRRLKTLDFWDQHGLAATLDAFEVKRRTLYLWKRAYHEGGLAGLAPASKAPHHRRRRQWPPPVVGRIRYLRRLLPNLGKEKVHKLLAPWCAKRRLKCSSITTIGRLIGDADDRMRTRPANLGARGQTRKNRPRKGLRRPKGYRPAAPGEGIGIDTIHRRMGHLITYLLTAIDECTGYAIAVAVPRNNSRYTSHFLPLCARTMPFPIQQVITDNGSEFKAQFDTSLKNNHIRHLLTYPNSPKMNAKNERFNRSI